MTKTILKWAGNKSKIMPKIVERFPKGYNRYLEPFAGSLGSYLHADVSCEAHLNDLNEEILNLFECVRDDYEKVVLMANKIEKSKENYYVVRNQDRTDGWLLEDRFVRAARTVYLNKTCFNGLYRVNKQGFSNVPYGSGRKGDVLPLKDAAAFSQAVQNVHFSCKDYLSFLQMAKSGDLIYMDPPYVDVKEPLKEFNGYVGGFGWTQQEELVKECQRLQSIGCKVVVSNSHCDATMKLYGDAGFDISLVEAPRYISCKKDGRKPVTEIVATLF